MSNSNTDLGRMEPFQHQLDKITDDSKEPSEVDFNFNEGECIETRLPLDWDEFDFNEDIFLQKEEQSGVSKKILACRLGRFAVVAVIFIVFLTVGVVLVTTSGSHGASGKTSSAINKNDDKEISFSSSYSPSSFPSILLPSAKPTESPISRKTLEPTLIFVTAPSLRPSRNSSSPTTIPSNAPSQNIFPTSYPSPLPSLHPSILSSSSPSLFPSAFITFSPTINPTIQSTIWENKMLNDINHARLEIGAPELCLNSKLTQAANQHVNDMALHEFVSTTGTDNSTPKSRAKDSGYTVYEIGQTALYGYESVDEAVEKLLREDGELRDLILYDGYVHAGFARSSKYWTQVLASSKNDVEICDG